MNFAFVQQNFELLMTFYTPDVYEGPAREAGSYHQIAAVSDDSSSKRVCYKYGGSIALKTFIILQSLL